MTTALTNRPYTEVEAIDRRRLAEKEDALRALASLHASAKKALAAATAAGAGVAKAAEYVIQAILAMIQAILRFVARVFGMDRGQAPAAVADKGSPDQSASAVSALTVSDSMESEGAKFIEAAAAAKSPDGDAFLRALDFAGIAEADRALLNFVRDPNTLGNSSAPDALLAAALQKSEIVFAAIQTKVLQLQTERAQSAAELSKDFEPPLLIEDLLGMYRKNRELGLESPAKKSAIDRLLRADDDLGAATAHHAMVTEMIVLVAGAANTAGVDLMPYAGRLQRLAGESWMERVFEVKSTASAADAALKVEPVPAKTAPSDAAATATAAEAAQQAAADFLSKLTATSKPAAPVAGAPKSASERLRRASLAAAKFLPLEDHNGFPLRDDVEDPPKP